MNAMHPPRSRHLPTTFTLLLALTSALTSCRPADPEPVGVTSSPPAAESIEALADRFYESSLAGFPEIAYFVGIDHPDHAGLRDRTEAGLAAWERIEDELLAELDAVDVDGLVGTPAWVTAGMLREALEASIGLRICRHELWAVSQMAGWQLLYPQVAARQPVETAEHRAMALERWGAFPDFVRTELANLRRGLEAGYSSPRSAAERVLAQLDALVDLSGDDSPFASPAVRSSDPDFATELRALVRDEIHPALVEYRDFLRDEYLDAARTEIAITANPDGRVCYEASLRDYTTLPRSPEEVFRLGRETVDQNKHRIVELGEELFGSSDFEEILARIDEDPANRFEDRDELLAFALDAVARAERAMPPVFERLPSRAATVEPYPDYQDGTGVSSRYEAPQGDGPGVFRITLARPEEQRRSNVEITAFHETYPGHHVQVALAHELDDVHPMANLVLNSGFAEGWARYSESLSEELGLYQETAALIGRRAWPARGMVVDPGIHVLGWTREQAIEFMLESGRMDGWEDANDMVDRIAVLPGQLTAYDSGALEIFALRAEAEAALGDRFDLGAFHRTILENGSVPLPMLRALVEAWIEDA